MRKAEEARREGEERRLEGGGREAVFRCFKDLKMENKLHLFCFYGFKGSKRVGVKVTVQ